MRLAIGQVVALSFSESVVVLAPVTRKDVALLAVLEFDLVVAEAVVIGVVVMAVVELAVVTADTELEAPDVEVKGLVVVVTGEPSKKKHKNIH